MNVQTGITKLDIALPQRLPNLEHLSLGSASSSSGLKLRKAAQDFESILLSSLLDQMKESFSGSLGGEDGDSADGTVQGLAVSTISSALAASGGLGIGKMVLHVLQAEPPAKSLMSDQTQSSSAIKALPELADGIGGGEK